MPLNAGPFSYHAHVGERRSDAAVQVDRGFHDAPAGLRLLLGAALHRIGAGHPIP
jgi:hypothetical protein